MEFGHLWEGTKADPRKKKKKALNNMVARDIDGSMGIEINKLRREITDLLDSKEIMWQ